MVKKGIRFLKWVGIILGTVFLVLSLVPWLIPVPEVTEPPVPGDMQTLEFDGQVIRYRSMVPDDSMVSQKPVMILLHGFCGSAWNWKNFQDSIAHHGYRSVAVDIPPFGYSRVSDPAMYTDEHRIAAIRAVMQHTFPGMNWIVAGHSMGATIAGQVALADTSVIGVLCVDGAPFGGAGRPGIARVLRYPPLIRWAEVIGFRQLLTFHGVQDLLRSAFAREPDSIQVHHYLSPMRRPGFPEDLFTWSSQPGRGLPAWVKDRCEMLMVWGTRDSWIPASAGQRFCQTFPGSRLRMIEGAGHCPMETHLNQMLPIVVQWADSAFSLP